ncbi:threonylcarbamoyl-AMP synthase [Kocuria coralli]|uniref:L-threonylcarbamoyladenylate synthase n=1 Tax=Kocuria coralli TaxID=1461025 RepID=A0A5J5L126_9MICC|nr:threonylcarbamoyl-AMP synthase [Kocuria coralli]
MTAVNETPQDNSSGSGSEPEAEQQETTVYDCSSEKQRAVGIKHAQQVLATEQCVVMPTDTVYGIAADAFSAAGVRHLLETKGRNRTMPPPVLIAHAGVLDGLADEVSEAARALAEAFWPGGLTLICHAQPSLQWDLGETRGTVALRVPDDEVAVALLSQTGPLAVSSANRTGLPAATSAGEAREMLGDKVEVYLDAGTRGSTLPAQHPVASTIVDCTGETPVVVRDGAISLARLRAVVPSVIGLGAAVPDEEETAAGGDAETPDTFSTEPQAGENDVVETNAEPAEEEAPARPGEPAGQADADDEVLHPDPEAPAPTRAAQDEQDEPARGEPGRQEAVPDGSSSGPSRRPAGLDQAAALVASGAAVSGRGTAASPDQDRRRQQRPRTAGEPRPVDRATAASIVARGVVDETVGAEAADQAGG